MITNTLVRIVHVLINYLDMDSRRDKSTWAIGGGLMVGLGVGFFFLPTAPLAFVGCIIAGLGIGLIITAAISKP